ncbi:finger, C2H2-type domain-containing [Octopus vulgaris]|uniref:Finger, C2H2-type domain-containing n=2 Tax=Octopus TaxID=6643 RepID=A0AA36FFR5_OCTVU|nr:uncharacterized protein LOC115220710 [Octopus sinensis]CAI9735529.1 finger, C2H2-type domain-containing [Octopus vulgaris]
MNICLLLWQVIFLVNIYSVKTACLRDRARIVREILRKRIFKSFKDTKVDMPYSCPFTEERDVYIIQERQKYMKSLTKWHCSFCGKEFYGENYLDKHFDNRHPQYVRTGNDSVCLADYCDVFRCEILSGALEPNYWDMALCLEDDMFELQQKCMEVIKECIPSTASTNSSRHIQDVFSNEVCSFLDCRRYWEAPFPQGASIGTAAYIIMSVILVFFLSLYYCIAYHYFYTDSFIDYQPMEFSKGEHVYNNPTTSNVNIRYRPATRTLQHPLV